MNLNDVDVDAVIGTAAEPRAPAPRRLTDEQLDTLVHEFLGSCRGEDLDFLGPEFEGTGLYDLDRDDLLKFDDRAWLCKGCNWWVGTIETNDDELCSSCQDEETEEEKHE